jgi:hypothetical protein
MTGRAAHDALLGLLTDGPARAALLSGGPPPAALGGARFDRERVRRMARFLGRHFYRERIVRLCRHVRALADPLGMDPAALVDDPGFAPFVDRIVLGSPEAAAEVADRVEALFGAMSRPDAPWLEALVRYDALRLRVDGGGPARRFDSAWDLPALLPKLERAVPAIPAAARRDVSLLVFRRGDRVSTAFFTDEAVAALAAEGIPWT